MGSWRAHIGHWLQHEEGGEETSAESELTQLFAALPSAELSNAFVERTARRAWQARVRQRRLRLVGVAAALLIAAVLSGAFIYGVLRGSEGTLLASIGSLLAGTAVQLFKGTVTVMTWWSAAAAAGAAVAGVVALPQGALVVALAELTGAAALFCLYRLLRSGELRVTRPGSLCF